MEIGRKFLRCLIKSKEDENLADNAFITLDAPVDFKGSNSALQEVYDFVKGYYNDFNELPTFKLLGDEFESRMLLDAKEELKEIAKFTPHTGTGFRFILKECVKELQREKFNEVVALANKINNGDEYRLGKHPGAQVLKGTQDALDFIFQNSEQFFYSTLNEKTESELSTATADALKRLENAKKNPYANYGVMSGYTPIDKAIKGVKRKELLLVAGATGECKTTFAVNWAYNAARYGGFNVLYVSLEMSRENMENIEFCLHTNNQELQLSIPKRSSLVAVPFDDIKNGHLSPLQEYIYRYALADWAERGTTSKDNKVPYGKFRIWEPNSELTPTMLASKLNYFHKIDPVDMLVVDHPGLMVPDKHTPGMSESASLNQVMKKLKQLALTFNHNQGVAIIAPFQINREGKKEVVKKTEKDGEAPTDWANVTKPVYNTFHLSYANEAERSSDYIIYTYLNHELRQNNKLHIGCIKNRHGEIFSPFLCDTSLPTRRIWYADPSDGVALGEVQEVTL